ncbi:MAG: hypothetical protein HQL87_03255 [Magnetococcales bacterium]|nr:hypothetical protein [Magnetococcales bacterium]
MDGGTLHPPTKGIPTMYSIPATYLNAIYKNQKKRLVSPWAKRVFGLSMEAIDEQVGLKEKELAAQGIPNVVIVTYVTVMPLLWENRAIQAWLRENELGASPVLPDINTVEEAVYIGNLDWPMNEQEQDKLRVLLRSPPT